MTTPITKRTSQYIDNLGFDEANQLPMKETVYSPDGGTTVRRLIVNSDGSINAVSGVTPTMFDYIAIPSYNSNNDPLIVIYKTGGASGTTVATLTITYDTSFNITSVTRS